MSKLHSLFIRLDDKEKACVERLRNKVERTNSIKFNKSAVIKSAIGILGKLKMDLSGVKSENNLADEILEGG